MSETLLDVKGLACPLPVLRANRALRGMASGERLRVLATDRAAIADFQAFCRETGHALLAWSEDAGTLSFVIRWRALMPRHDEGSVHRHRAVHSSGMPGTRPGPRPSGKSGPAATGCGSPGRRGFPGLVRHSCPRATPEQLALVHEPGYVDAILALDPGPGDYWALDPDTVVSAGSVEAALRAAGGVLAAVDAVLEGSAQNAFVATRPPGHHAEKARAMGFCLFATAAIGARHAQERWGLGRVAVVDFDVHHGNGTQAAFWDQPSLFYASSHQSPCFPGTGAARETGAAGNIVNCPMPPGTGGARFRQAWEHTILPALDAFGPELLIVSAGFDAHAADPLAQFQLRTEDFGWITAALVERARRHCAGRIVSVLEGGYNLDALTASCALHVRTLLQA